MIIFIKFIWDWVLRYLCSSVRACGMSYVIICIWFRSCLHILSNLKIDVGFCFCFSPLVCVFMCVYCLCSQGSLKFKPCVTWFRFNCWIRAKMKFEKVRMKENLCNFFLHKKMYSPIVGCIMSIDIIFVLVALCFEASLVMWDVWSLQGCPFKSVRCVFLDRWEVMGT